jgi:hypothetical protein
MPDPALTWIPVACPYTGQKRIQTPDERFAIDSPRTRGKRWELMDRAARTEERFPSLRAAKARAAEIAATPHPVDSILDVLSRAIASEELIDLINVAPEAAERLVALDAEGKLGNPTEGAKARFRWAFGEDYSTATIRACAAKVTLETDTDDDDGCTEIEVPALALRGAEDWDTVTYRTCNGPAVIGIVRSDGCVESDVRPDVVFAALAEGNTNDHAIGIACALLTVIRDDDGDHAIGEYVRNNHEDAGTDLGPYPEYIDWACVGRDARFNGEADHLRIAPEVYAIYNPAGA